MDAPVPAKKVVVTLPESLRRHGRPVYMGLLELFQRRGLSGATASRALAGFTSGGRVASADHVELGEPLPIRVEAVGTAADIAALLPDVYDLVDDGMVELQDVMAVRLGGPAAPSPEGKEGLVRLVGKAKMLRIHVGEGDRHGADPLYEAIVRRARQLDIAGATVYRGILGYGAQKRFHQPKALSLSKDAPILVTVIDEEEKVDRLLAALDDLLTEGCLVAISDVTVVKYAPHSKP